MAIVVGLFKGAVYGALVGLTLYLMGLVVEFLNCACHIITCTCDNSDNGVIPAMWTGNTFWSVLIFCTIAGAVIGLIYGICQHNGMIQQKNSAKRAESYEVAKKERQRCAEEIKEMASKIAAACERNANTDINPFATTYILDRKMDEIIGELTDAAELKGKLKAIVNDIDEKGGADE